MTRGHSSTLTIGQLAAHAGVTVRAVRHYHAKGLLREPERDASGYRRYGAQSVVDLIRIRTLAAGGVPLARIAALLAAPSTDFTAALAGIDRTLQRRIRELQAHRRHLAELAEGDRLFLPESIVQLLDDLRALGVSERTVEIERDGWILVSALMPERVPQWVEEKRAAMADPGFRRLYLACDGARDWDASDPRLDNIEDMLVDYAREHRVARSEPPDRTDAEPGVGLLFAHVADISPAWSRLNSVQDRPRSTGPPSRRGRTRGGRHASA